MAKTFEVITAALCFTVLVGFAHCKTDEYIVEGKVYCDTCRVEFETPVSYSLPDAKVVLECKNESTKEVTFKKEGVTNSTGQYAIAVVSRGDEVCEVSLLESSDPNCNQLLDGSVKSDKLTLTDKDGLTNNGRYANPLGFVPKETLPQCKGVLIKMGVLPAGVSFTNLPSHLS